MLVNRLNQIYEQDLAIRLLLVAGNDQLNLDTAAAATGANGPCGAAACYTATQLQTCSGDTLERTNAVAGRILGAGSYDLAHLVMAANGGGIAGLGVVGTAFKGRACTALPNPVGDAFDVDFVAHEVGHQFGGEHTFNSRQCMGNLAETGAVRVEPGSGSSIMAYAGTCGADDLQDHSDPYFSQASVAQIGTQARRAEESQPAVQQVALNGFGGGDGFAFSYNGATSARVTESVNFTTNAIRNAIQGIAGWPAGAQVTVTGLSQRGFLVYFFGLAAPARLEVVDPAGFNGGFTAVVAENGATRFGGAPQATANRTPSVALRGAATYTIPARTPFLLDATGSDLDGDPLTYLWEQNDPGGDTNGTPLFDAARTDGPLFRIFGDAPVVGANAAGTATWRSFPDVDQVLDDNTNAVRACADVTCFSEFLPTGAWLGIGGNRTMHFRVTARDNHPGFGGLEAADVALTVAPGAGPFRLTSQATAGATTGGAALPVTWAVAGTDANGVNASQVKISLSLDGGRTFSKVLAAATPNDGSELVAVPRVGTADGRIKVEAVGNVFYDAARGALAIDSGFPVLLNGPPSADLGAASVGSAGAVTTITFTSDGPAPAEHRRAHARRRRRRCREHRLRRVQRPAGRLLRRVRGDGPARSDPRRRAVRDAQPGEQRPDLSHDRRADRLGHRNSAAGGAGWRRHAGDPDRTRLRPAAGGRRTARHEEPVRRRDGGQPAPVHEEQVDEARQAEGHDDPRRGGLLRRLVLRQGDREAHAHAAQGPQARLQLHPRPVAEARRPRGEPAAAQAQPVGSHADRRGAQGGAHADGHERLPAGEPHLHVDDLMSSSPRRRSSSTRSTALVVSAIARS